MIERELERRVENIEETLEVLNTLPARMGNLETRLGNLGTQFLQFRQEVREEFSATRGLHQAALVHASRLHEDALNQARIMHEDLVNRIKLLSER